MSGYIAEFEAPDGSTATLSGDDVIAPTVPDEHSVINEWSFQTPASPSLEAYRHGRVTLWFEADNGDRRLIQTGPVDAVTTDDGRGRTTIRAHDDFQTLAETGPEGTIVADGEAADEIAAVWSETPFEADVIKPEPRPVAEGRVIQDGDLTDVFSTLPADAPFVVEDGTLKPTPVSFVFEAESGGSATYTPGSEDFFSGGEAQGFGTQFASAGDNLTFNFTPQFDIEQPVFLLRRLLDDRGASDFEDTVKLPALKYSIGGWDEQTGDPFSIGFSEPLEMEWETITPTGGSTLQAGTSYTFEIEITSAEEDEYDGLIYDVAAVTDERFADSLTLDNEVHEPEGYLDGPEEIAPAAQAVADIVEVPNSIEAAELTVASDTAGTQSLAIEFGPDGDFTADFSGNNTQTLSGDNPGDLVSDIRAAVTLGYTDATRDDQTPRTGFEAQKLTSWELAVDEVSIIVFNEREFSGNWYQILQEMHREGNLIFRNIPTDGSDLKAETFEKGALSDDVEWTRLGFDRAFEGLTEYANVLTAVGGEADDGTRPVVTVSDEDEIARVGDEKPAFRLFESRTDERALLNRAQAELRGLTDDQLSGSVEIVPRRLKPGYAYEVDAFDGETVVLQRMRFEDGTQPRGSLEFLQRRDVSNAISAVRRETRSGER